MTHLKVGDEVIVKVLEGHVKYDHLKITKKDKFHKGIVKGVATSGSCYIELEETLTVIDCLEGKKTKVSLVLNLKNWTQLIVIKRVSSPTYSKVFWSGKGKKKVKTMTEQHTLEFSPLYKSTTAQS